MLQTDGRNQSFFNRETIYLVFRHRGLLFLTLAGTLLFSAIFYVQTPLKYEASSKILVKLGREKSATNLMSQNDSFFSADLKSEDINTEIEIIKSLDLLKELVRKKGIRTYLGRDLTGDNERDTQRAIESIQKKLNVEQIINTNVIDVRFQAGNPQEAADTVNQLVDLYMDKSVTVHSIQGIRELISRQADLSKMELERIEQRLEKYYSGADEKNPGYTSPHGSGPSGSEPSESINFMEKRLLELEFEKKKLLNQFRKDSQPVEDIEKQIGEINQMLVAERKKYGAQSKQYNELERLKMIAQDRNMLYQKKLDEIRILEAMDQNKIVSVSLLSRANPPIHPLNNGLMVTLLAALGLGGLLSIILLLIVHYTDETYHEDTRLERNFKIPVVASIPLMGRLEGDKESYERTRKKAALPSAVRPAG
jgi:uncharacterized protein involved in exopolysaccharide biosynthesis